MLCWILEWRKWRWCLRWLCEWISAEKKRCRKNTISVSQLQDHGATNETNNMREYRAEGDDKSKHFSIFSFHTQTRTKQTTKKKKKLDRQVTSSCPFLASYHHHRRLNQHRRQSLDRLPLCYSVIAEWASRVWVRVGVLKRHVEQSDEWKQKRKSSKKKECAASEGDTRRGQRERERESMTDWIQTKRWRCR